MTSESLPESHPPFHASTPGATCPVTGHSHSFIAPKEGDSRSPCPALNVMANHGYIARDGKNLSAHEVTIGLQKCYSLSTPLAYFLAYGGFLALWKIGSRISLYEIGRHSVIEHHASLVHHDCPKGEKYAPTEIDHTLVEALCSDVRPTAEEVGAKKAKGERSEFLMDVQDVARARIRRENECRPINALQARLARGEMAIILGVMAVTVGEKTGIPVEWLRTWIGEEKLPEDWKPNHVEGLWDVIKRGHKILALVNKLRAEEASDRKAD